MFGFEKLEVWQKSKLLTVEVYKLCKSLPDHERYGLVSQLQRAVISVSSNLAEGTARQTEKDKAHFTTMAYSSLMETVNHLIIANELGYLKDKDLALLQSKAQEIAKMLSGLRKSQIKSRS